MGATSGPAVTHDVSDHDRADLTRPQAAINLVIGYHPSELRPAGDAKPLVYPGEVIFDRPRRQRERYGDCRAGCALRRQRDDLPFTGSELGCLGWRELS